MIFPPSRISALIKRLEAGESVSQEDVDRLATLQALDLAVMGEEFALEAVQREADYTQEFRRQLEG